MTEAGAGDRALAEELTAIESRIESSEQELAAKNEEAEAAAKRAESSRLADRANRWLGKGRRVEALLLSVEAIQLDTGIEARRALLESVQASRRGTSEAYLGGSPSRMALSPDGQVYVSSVLSKPLLDVHSLKNGATTLDLSVGKTGLLRPRLRFMEFIGPERLVLLVTHDQRIAARCQSVVQIEAGRLLDPPLPERRAG